MIQAAALNPTEQRFHYISADLTDASECVRILEEVKAWNNKKPPDIVWCIAGAAYPEMFIQMEATRLQDQLNQNYWTAAYIAHAALREWLRPINSSVGDTQKHHTSQELKHLIFTSSVAAFSPPVGYSAYAPGKAALRSLSDVLSQELKLYHGARRHPSQAGPASEVRIHNIFPGTIHSPGYAQENLTKPGITSKLEETDKGLTEDEVALASLKGLQRGEYLITTGFLGSLMRAPAWGSSPRNNRLIDTLLSWVASIAWLFVQPDLDRQVTRWGEEHGHPSTY